ncbi:MED6 mediator sub complex component-domain-containing protein, partial [Massariosphaeria phaeospora]
MPRVVQPHDEQEFDVPALLRDLPGGTLNSDSVLWYFANSPFFDSASNNVALINQVRGTADESILWNRTAFEEALQTRFQVGVQFIVAAEPQAPGQPWVIQRQNRWYDENTGEIKAGLEGTYFTQGTKISMAPSLWDVLESRLLNMIIHTDQMFQISHAHTHFSPATGHTYLPPSHDEPRTSVASRPASPGPSLSADPDPSASQAQTTQLPEQGVSTTEYSDELFMDSLNKLIQYGQEFIDENPLQGEPGAFVFSNTLGHVEARNKEASEASQSQNPTAAAPALSTLANLKTENATSPVASVTSTPKPAPTPAPAPTEALSRKGSTANLPKATKEKRRKSKGLTSPTTPTVP